MHDAANPVKTWCLLVTCCVVDVWNVFTVGFNSNTYNASRSSETITHVIYNTVVISDMKSSESL